MSPLRFPLLAAVLTIVAAGVAAWLRPGRLDVLAGSALGTGVAGAFAAIAMIVVDRLRRAGGTDVGSRMVSAFVGLMAARMLGYLALVLAAVFLGAGEPVSVCLGLLGGTLVFLTLEVVHLRKMT